MNLEVFKALCVHLICIACYGKMFNRALGINIYGRPSSYLGVSEASEEMYNRFDVHKLGFERRKGVDVTAETTGIYVRDKRRISKSKKERTRCANDCDCGNGWDSRLVLNCTTPDTLTTIPKLKDELLVVDIKKM